MMKKYMYIIAFLGLLSCSNKHKNWQEDNDNDTIFVSYYPCVFESNLRISCAVLAEKSEKAQTDSVIHLQQEYYDRVKNFLQKTNNTSTIDGCDSRMFIEHGKNKMCIGQNSCLCDISESRMETDMEVLYIIKWKSGFFNCFDKDELSLDSTIEKYGFPDDYIYNEGQNTSDINQIKRISLRKIAFVPSN